MAVIIRYLLILLAAAPLLAEAGIETGDGFKRYEGEELFFVRYSFSHPTKQVIAINGTMHLSKEEMDEATSVFANLDPRKEIILYLDSFSGGYIHNAEEFVKRVKDTCKQNRDKEDPKQSCQITSYVGTSWSCTSACIIPFMAGKRRIACPASTFGFHSVSYGEELASDEENLRMLLLRGIFKTWILKNFDMFRSIEVTRLTPKDMVGSNIVTEIDQNCSYLKGTRPEMGE